MTMLPEVLDGAPSSTRALLKDGRGKRLHGDASTPPRLQQELTRLLSTVQAVREGNFHVRRADAGSPLVRRIGASLNGIIELNERLADELARVSRIVGQEGRMTERASIGLAKGTWATSVNSVNALIGDLVQPTNEVARVLTSVARGDLSQKMSLEIQGRSVKGEFYRIGTTVNAMVDQLSSFAAEVTRVAKEVGTEGKLGGQAKVKGVSGVWKDLTDNVNQLGYLPTVVASGEAALCSIEAAPPDLVLMDIILQGPMDGVQVAERIRARFEIPIIYVTAHADRATLERAKRTRPSGYLIKPYEDDELRQAIGHALGDPRADG